MIAEDSAQLLQYLLKTGPIPLSDLVLRSDNPSQTLRTLAESIERGEVNVQGTRIRSKEIAEKLTNMMNEIEAEPGAGPEVVRQRYYDRLLEGPAETTVVGLSEKGFKKL